MKAERQQKERTSRVIQPSKGGTGRIVDNRPEFLDQSNTINSIQLKTFTKHGNPHYTVDVPTDDTHWTVSSPKEVIGDRVGTLRGPMFNIDPQITRLQPRRAHAGQVGVKYGAKHFGGNAAAGLSGTVCHVANNGEETGRSLTIPHYHACRKDVGLTNDEASGNAAVAGMNDGMHLHTSQDVARVGIELNTLAVQTLNTAGETLIDQFPNQIP